MGAVQASVWFRRLGTARRTIRPDGFATHDDHLVASTYELLRNHYGAPPRTAPDGRQVGATLGLMRSLLLLNTPGITPIACAFDHTNESFRNRL